MTQNRRLVTLSALCGLLSQSVRPEEFLPGAIEMAAEVMNVETVLLYLLEAKERELVLSAYRGVSQEFAHRMGRIRLGDGFNGRVAETGEPMFVSDADHDHRCLFRDMVEHEKLRAQLIVPMKSRGQVVGTICVAIPAERQFQAAEIELLSALANQIGIAIDEARLYQEQLLTIELLRRSEAKYRELFQDASDAIITHDLEGRIIDANKACERLLGYPVSELVERKVSEFLHEDALELARKIRRKLLNGERVEQRYEQHLVKRDGTEAIVELATRLIIKDDKPVGFENIGRDVTEERKLRDNLRFHLRQVLKAQEEERKRISRELHDDAGQSLLLLIRRLDAIASDPERKLSRSVKQRLARLHDLAVEILNGLRRYAQQLRPAILDDLGLAAALEWMADDLAKAGIEVVANIEKAELGLSREVELVLFRIAQEALSNVRKHAEASKVVIRLEPVEGKIGMVIADDGKGFETPKRLSDLSSTGKLGIVGMQERAHLLGGTLNIQSEPGKGTTVVIDIPIRPVM